MAGSISPKSLETLIDLVEVKLSCFEVWDRDDKRERILLENTLLDLKSLACGEETEAHETTSPARRGRPRSNGHLQMAS